MLKINQPETNLSLIKINHKLTNRRKDHFYCWSASYRHWEVFD